MVEKPFLTYADQPGDSHDRGHPPRYPPVIQRDDPHTAQHRKPPPYAQRGLVGVTCDPALNRSNFDSETGISRRKTNYPDGCNTDQYRSAQISPMSYVSFRQAAFLHGKQPLDPPLGRKVSTV